MRYSYAHVDGIYIVGQGCSLFELSRGSCDRRYTGEDFSDWVGDFGLGCEEMNLGDLVAFFPGDFNLRKVEPM